jgi:hypothetical protein
MTNCWMLLSFSLTMVHRTPAGVTVARGFGRSASLSQKFSGGETGTGTEVEVDYQPPQGNRLEEKDRVLTRATHETRQLQNSCTKPRFKTVSGIHRYADTDTSVDGF